MYKIIGKLAHSSLEELDYAASIEDALILRDRRRNVLGSNWSIWIEPEIACNECGAPALYIYKGSDDDNYPDPDSYWCETHRKIGSSDID